MVSFIISIFSIILLGIIIFITYSNYVDKKWSTLHVERKTITIDNREDPYYKRNGFHPYDTMLDIDVLHSVYEVQKDVSGKFRVKHSGLVDAELERKAYKLMNKMSNTESINKP